MIVTLTFVVKIRFHFPSIKSENKCNTQGENKYILKHQFNHSKHFEITLTNLEKNKMFSAKKGLQVVAGRSRIGRGGEGRGRLGGSEKSLRLRLFS